MKYFRLISIVVIAALTASCEKNQFEKGLDFYNQQKFMEAVEAFTTYIDTHPKHAQSYYNRGRAWEELGNTEKAVGDYQQAIDLDPNQNTFRMSSGLANFKLKKYGQVVMDMNALIKQNPNFAEAYYIRGRALVQEGMVRDALKSYDTAINHDPDYSEAIMHRGILKVLTDQKDSGCSDLRKAQQMGEDEASSYLQKYCR